MSNNNGASRKTVLVADDDALIRDLLFMALSDNGYKPLAVSNGIEALAEIETYTRHGGTVDLLVTDIRMPHMDGLTLIEELEKRNIFIPTLALTGFGDRDLLIKLIRKGCREYLDKPFNIDDFIRRVDALFAKERRVHAEIVRYVQMIEERRTPALSGPAPGPSGAVVMRAVSGHLAFEVRGELNDDVAGHLRDMVEDHLKENQKLMLNLANVPYVSSYGMGVIIYLWKKVKELNGSLCLISGESRLKKKIEELNLERVMKIYATETELTGSL